MPYSKTMMKLMSAVVGVSVWVAAPRVQAGPIEDARFGVQQAQDQLRGADAQLHDATVADAQTQADLAQARQHVADVGNALNGESHHLADLQGQLGTLHGNTESLERAARAAGEQVAIQQGALASAQQRIAAAQGGIDALHAQEEARFEDRRDVRDLKADYAAAKAQADLISDGAVRRLSFTREYRHEFDDQDAAQRWVDSLSHARHVDPRELAQANDRLAAAKARLADFVQRNLDADPVVRGARINADNLAQRLHDRHEEFEHDFPHRPEVAAAFGELNAAHQAADAANAALAAASADQARAQGAFDQQRASIAPLVDAAHASQDRVDDLTGQLQAAQGQVAGLEAHARDLDAAIAADRANRDQAAAVLAQREQTLGVLVSAPPVYVPQPVYVPEHVYVREQPVVVVTPPPPPPEHDDAFIGIGGLAIDLQIGGDHRHDHDRDYDRARAEEAARQEAQRRADIERAHRDERDASAR